MVPDYFTLANSKSQESLRFAEFVIENRKFLGSLAQISCLRHRPQNTLQKHQLSAITRLRRGVSSTVIASLQTPAYDYPDIRDPAATIHSVVDRWNASTASRQYIYPKRQYDVPSNGARIALQAIEGKIIWTQTSKYVSSSAAGAISPAGYDTRNCGASQPDQPNQEPRFNIISKAVFRRSVIKANNRLDRTVV